MQVQLHSGVLVLHEKHGRLYYHIPNQEELHKVALMVLWGRMTSGNWYAEPKEPESPGYTADTLTSLPKDLQKHAEQKLKGYQQALRFYLHEREWWDEAHRALKAQDGRLAWQLLSDRSDAEYERVTLETYSTG